MGDLVKTFWRGKYRFAFFSATGALLVAGVLVFANILSRYFYLRMDLSEGHIYSLSQASRQMFQRLEDPVYVHAYFSPSLPPQFAAVRDYLENLLKEYGAYSRGKVRFEFHASDDPAAFREAALREGIYPIRFNILEKERYEIREAFLGLVVKYLDKKEVMPFLQDTAGLEYDLTSRIRKMMRPKKKTLGYVVSNGTLELDELPRPVRTKLEEGYEVRSVALAEVSSDTIRSLDALLLIGPDQKLEDRAVFILDQFLLAGKPIALALDAKRVDMRSFIGAPLDLGLDGWLMHLGLPMHKNLALDLQSQKISISAQQGWMSVTNIIDYPPFVVSTDLNSEHPLTKGLDSVIFPYAAPIDVSTAAAGVQHTVLARSSRKSWENAAWERQFARLTPFETQVPGPQDIRGPFVLAAAVEGRFKSYFPAPPKPKEEGKDEKSKGSDEGKSPQTPPEPMLFESQTPGRVLVVGTSRFIHQDFPLPETNQAFFLNLADWLAQDPDLIAIRSKTVAFRPLREISPGWKTTVRYSNLLCGPTLIVAIGLLRWRRRKSKTDRRTLLYRAGSEGESA